MLRIIRHFPARTSILLIPVLLLWCAGMAPTSAPSGGQYRGRSAPESPAEEMEGAAGMSDRDAPGSPDDAPGKAATVRQQPGPRMVVYTAGYRIGVESVRQTIDRVKEMTVRHGGFIESIHTSDSYMAAKIVARVPVAKFNDALEETEKLGRVEQKSVSATDVTMQFSDVTLRIDTAKKVRDRLYELLRRVEKSREKVDILREIARLTTEIDNMTAEREHLRSRASFSTLTLSLRALVRDIARRYIASPFGWIAGLGHQRRSIVHGRDGDLLYQTPRGFFDFEKEFFSARSGVQFLHANPDNTVRMRLGVVDNYPPADQKFWEEAVKLDIDNRMYQVKGADTVAARPGLLFNRYVISLAGGDYYTVAFAVKGKKIIVFESLVKDEKAFRESAAAVETFIKSVGYDE